MKILFEENKKKLNIFEIRSTGVVIKPPKPIKVIFLLYTKSDDKFNNILKMKLNLFLEFITSILILSFLILSK